MLLKPLSSPAGILQERFLGEYESNRRRHSNIYKFLINSMQVRASAVYLVDSDEEESLVSVLGKGVVCCLLGNDLKVFKGEFREPRFD